MHKIWRLYQNEMYKVMHRKLTLVMTIILLGVLLLTNIGVRLLYQVFESDEPEEVLWSDQQLSVLGEIAFERGQLERLKQQAAMPSEIQAAEDRIAVLETCASQEYYEANRDKNVVKDAFIQVDWMLMQQIDRLLLFIFSILIAGTAVSSEIVSGSIKSLIIAPVKRWKIFLAKSLMILTMMAGGVILTWTVSALLQGLFFGFGNSLPYTAMIGGSVRVIPYLLYTLEYLVVSMFDILALCVFALMLSAVMRNSAASIAISMGVYFVVSGIVNTIVLFIGQGWVKYIPFVNFDLHERLFPSSGLGAIGVLLGGDLSDVLGATMGLNRALPSVAFSLVFLTVLMIGMYYTALDSFCRRDITR